MFTVMYVLTAISIDPDFSQILRFQSTQTQCSLIILEPFNHGQSLPHLQCSYGFGPSLRSCTEESKKRGVMFAIGKGFAKVGEGI